VFRMCVTHVCPLQRVPSNHTLTSASALLGYLADDKAPGDGHGLPSPVQGLA
jgi:hypothetical protein